MNPKEKQILKMLLEFFQITFILVALVIVVYIFIGQLLEVSGESMYPTFKDKEQILAEKLTIKYKDPTRSEVAIFNSPQNKDVLLIKRVIGLPGDTFMIKDGSVYINGSLLKEPYLTSGTKTEGNIELKEGVEYKIPADQYVMLGDNRSVSTDSRYWGMIKKETILGRGFLIYYPTQDFKLLF
jgi:signal peptidase I